MTNFAAKYPPVTAAGGGGGTGTVTQVNTGAGLTGGPISTIGTVSLLPVATNRALVSDGSGILAAATTTATEIGYVNGVTSAIQTQINSKQATLTIGNLTDAGTDGITVTGGTGAVIGAGTSLSQHVADGTHNGYLSSADWTTFNAKQAALTIGNLTDVGTDGIIVTGGTSSIIGTGTSITQTKSDATHNGYLASADWTTFNGKQAALTIGNLTDAGTDGITVTGGTGSVIGSGTSISQHVADTTHSGYLSSTDWNTFNGKQASGNYITALTGDVTATGPGSVASTVAKIAGTTVSGTTGSGNVAFSTSPTFVTPVLGTPSSGNLSNCTNYPTYSPGTTAGVVSTSGLAGTTTSGAAAAGFIGEVFSITRSLANHLTITNNATSNLTNFADSAASITPTAGWWLVSASVTFEYTANFTSFNVGVSKSSGAQPSSNTFSNPTSGECRVQYAQVSGNPGAGVSVTVPSFIAFYDGATPIFFTVSNSVSSGTTQASGSLFMYRVGH